MMDAVFIDEPFVLVASPDDKPLYRKGTIAVCSLGCLGLITESRPKEVEYVDGNKGFAWVGIHLTDKVSPVGSPWSSRTPFVVGHTDELAANFFLGGLPR